MSDTLREDLQRKNAAMLQLPDAARSKLFPSEVHVYYSLFPLEQIGYSQASKIFCFPTQLYKAISSIDGLPYILRRIEGRDFAMSIDGWRQLVHSNIVRVREAFTTRAFGDNFMVYDYHPLAQTLHQAHLSKQKNQSLPEYLLWTYIVQLVSAIKAVHDANLAVRVIDATKIILTGKNRVKINACGLLDILGFDGTNRSVMYQDLLGLGHLIIALATGSLASIHYIAQSVEHIAKSYSADLNNVVMYLMSKPSQFKCIDDVITMIAPRILHELNLQQTQSEALEGELGTELENGRIVRLMSKLGFINERPDIEFGQRWSETGDRYLLKLYRDYVFHQVDALGNPVVDMGHVLESLNKLDAGSSEKVMLMSRDEKSCLIVSYKDLNVCVATTFNELLNKGR